MLSKLKSLQENHEDGFSLIEILVVILIIGILASIAIPVFLNQRKKAVDAQLKTEMRSVAQYMETWKIDNPGKPYPRIAAQWKHGASLINTAWPDELKISEGTQIITSDSSTFAGYYGGKSLGVGEGYCIEGQALNSNFLLDDTNQRIWYNSLKGGFTDHCNIPAT